MMSEGTEEAAPVATAESKTIAALNSEAAQRRIENTKLTDQLAEIQRVQNEKDTKEAEEQGKWENLYETEKGKTTTLQEQLDAANGTITGINERDEKTFEKLLESVPEDMKEMVSDPTMDVSKRIAWAEKLSATKPGAPGPKPVGEHQPGNTMSAAEFAKLSPHDKMAYIKGGGRPKD